MIAKVSGHAIKRCLSRGERPWVKKEIEAGLIREGGEDREILIPLRLPGCVLPLLMESKDWADFTGPFEDGLENLLAPLSGGWRS